MKKIKYLGIIFGFLLSFQLSAQEVTDYDLQNFAHAYKEMIKLNNASQKEMATLIQKEKLDLEVYHAINESKESEYEPDVPKEDFDKYDKVQPQIQKLQNNLEKDVEKAYAKYDLTPQKYKAIAERVKLDYMLQAKLEQMLKKLGR